LAEKYDGSTVEIRYLPINPAITFSSSMPYLFFSIFFMFLAIGARSVVVWTTKILNKSASSLRGTRLQRAPCKGVICTMAKATFNQKKMFPDQRVFRQSFLENCTEKQLRNLIMKFASAEARCRVLGKSYQWKSLRDKAIIIYEKLYKNVPSILTGHSLPKPFGNVLFDKETNELPLRSDALCAPVFTALMSIDISSDGFVVRKRILIWVIFSIVATVFILSMYYWHAFHDDRNEDAPTFIILLFLAIPYMMMHWAFKGPKELFRASINGIEYYLQDMTLHVVPWEDIVEINAVPDEDGHDNLKTLFTSPRPRPYHGYVDTLNPSKVYFFMEGRRDVDKIALSGMELRNLYLEKTH